MVLDAWITLGVIGFCFSVLVLTRFAPYIILMGGVTLLLSFGVLTNQEAISGFANEGMITVGALFIVANGLNESGVVQWLSRNLLGRPGSTVGAQLRLMFPAAFLSAFINNTPVVAMLVPAVATWAKHNKLPVSRLMIPLSYAAIIGGCCTLIGTSTNLIINSMLMDQNQALGLKMFDLAWVGIPCAVAVIGFVVLTSPWLLPKRRAMQLDLDDARKYTVEMIVQPQTDLDGKTIEQAGLRHLHGLYLVRIDRGDHTLHVVGPKEILSGHDRLFFVGIVDSIVDLKKIRGLITPEEEKLNNQPAKESRSLVEVVVSPSCPLLGKSIRKGRFRSYYNASVIAVARNGEHLNMKIGNIVLRTGDTLLLDTTDHFLLQQRDTTDFLLVSAVENSQALRHNRSIIAILILLGMVISVTSNGFSMLNAALLAAGAMIITRCTSAVIAGKSIDWHVLVVIASSIALGKAVEKTGLATRAAELFLSGTHLGSTEVLISLFVFTALLTSVISNTAAAVLVFPIAVATSNALDISLTPLAITLMIAASASFATPIGYQTNLIVYGPGGYRFLDYLRIGIPITVLV
ncbi:MAG: SLC13 family permease, partial [Methylococcales bacterium]